MSKKITALLLCLLFVVGAAVVIPAGIGSAATTSSYIADYNANYPAYLQHEQPLADAFRANYNNSLAQAMVERAVWYMENGYMVYGHTKYAATGYIDCSNFVSLVYKNFGYSVTSAARNYNTVGQAVSGVYAKRQAGSSTKYQLVGADKLRPGDILTFWKKDSSGNKYIGHVALYMGKINDKPAIIHTVSGRPTAIGITTSFTYWYGEHLYGVRRVLPDSAQIPNGPRNDSGPVIPSVYALPPQKPVVLPRTFIPVNNTGSSVPTAGSVPVQTSQPGTSASTGSSGSISSGGSYHSTSYF